MTLPQDIAAMAESIVNTLTQTDYQHVDNIDPSTGIYDCDCNGFAAFILRAVALQNFSTRKWAPWSRGPARLNITISSLR
jgi:hypothetical protein